MMILKCPVPVRCVAGGAFRLCGKDNTDPDNPQEVASVTEEKKHLLTDIFWGDERHFIPHRNGY